MRTVNPQSKCHRIVAYIAEAGHPVTTKEIADQFGMASAVASATLCELSRRDLVMGRWTDACKRVWIANEHR